MSPDQQQPEQQQRIHPLNPAALQRLYARLGSQEHAIYELQATIEAQTADLTRHKDLLREALERFGPKPEDGEALHVEGSTTFTGAEAGQGATRPAAGEVALDDNVTRPMRRRTGG